MSPAFLSVDDSFLRCSLAVLAMQHWPRVRNFAEHYLHIAEGALAETASQYAR